MDEKNTEPSDTTTSSEDGSIVNEENNLDTATAEAEPASEKPKIKKLNITENLDLTVDDDDDDDHSIIIPATEVIEVDSFSDLKIEEDLLKAIKSIGWEKPTPVQGMCLPFTLAGKDVAGFAQTGTGKTGVFLITLAQTIQRAKENKVEGQPRAIILVPTRELAVQIQSDAKPLFDSLDISSLAVYGGVDYEKQAQQIRQGVDVIVATPGRLKDYFQKKVFNLRDCNQFVVDEADRMFDMGFVEDLEFFLEKMGDQPQKLLFSATTNESVKELAFEYLENPEYISINPEVMTPEKIEQFAILCESTEKLKVMLGLFKDHNPNCSVIFTNTKLVAEWLHYKLKGNGIDVELITGDLPQRKRISLINRIKKGEIKALIATDVASRGLHITGITHVYNFDLPNEASNYVHRIGRTARAGAKGVSYSLVCEDYGHNLQEILDYLGDRVKIETGWFKEEYLDIEDKALNPYKDPEFKSNSSKVESSSSARQGGERGRPARGDQKPRDGKDESRSNNRGRNRKGPRKDGEGPRSEAREGNSRPNNRGGKKRGGTQRKQDWQRNSEKNNQRQQKPNRNQRTPDKNRQAAKAPVQPTPAPSQSVGGLFKRIVGLMFGKKDKK